MHEVGNRTGSHIGQVVDLNRLTVSATRDTERMRARQREIRERETERMRARESKERDRHRECEQVREKRERETETETERMRVKELGVGGRD